jgi:hypothetical protein
MSNIYNQNNHSKQKQTIAQSIDQQINEQKRYNCSINSSHTISIMSWNILAHEYTYHNTPPGCRIKQQQQNTDTDENKQVPINTQQKKNNQQYNNETSQQYETRVERIFELLHTSDCAIICLQEVNVAVVQRLQIEFVETGKYEMEVAQGPPDVWKRFEGPSPGLCTLWKPSIVKCIATDKMQYIPQTNVTMTNPSCEHTEFGVLDEKWRENQHAKSTQSRGAFLSLLFERTVPNSSANMNSSTSTPRINIVNLHLDGAVGDRSRTWINEFRCNQLRTIELYTTKHQQGKNTNVIWIGDFNATPSVLDSFLLGRFDYVHKLDNCISRPNCGVDHIYVKNILNSCHGIIRIVPHSKQIEQQFGEQMNLRTLPWFENCSWPSDHYALFWNIDTNVYTNEIQHIRIRANINNNNTSNCTSKSMHRHRHPARTWTRKE